MTIRRQARELLEHYEKFACSRDLPSAFTTEGGSYRVLAEILKHCFDQSYNLAFKRTLPLNRRGEVNGTTVSVDRSQTETRRRFIISHEIGHIKLKHQPRGTKPFFQDTDDTLDEEPHQGELICRDGIAPAYRENDRYELEANIFAAELLAPLHIIKAKIEDDENWTVAGLAGYFGLSEGAMRNQLIAALIACPHPDVLEKPVEQTPELSPYLQVKGKQKEAVECATPALVIAGPGAGKTGVLSARYIRLVQEEGVSPSRILSLTFSNKAAAEMHERITRDLPDHAHEVQVYTYHSYGRFLLQSYGHTIGFEEEPAVLSDADSFVLARDHIHELSMGRFANLNDPTQHLEPLIARIQTLKEAQIKPAEFTHRVRTWGRQLKKLKESAIDTVSWQEDWKTALQCRDLAVFYHAYEVLRLKMNYVDYADLINVAISLFDNAEVAQTISGLYDHILVDEFQDINRSCGQLVHKTDGGRGIVWAVADPRQSIYSFRGASIFYLARFQQDYLGAKIHFLDKNYRSVKEIVDVGDAIQFPSVVNGEAFCPPPLEADKGNAAQSPAVTVSVCQTEGHEIAQMVKDVTEVIRTIPPDKVAILCRDKWLARRICLALEENGIATNWSGQLEEQDAFKDLMAVLQLAANQPQALLRLARMKEHFLCEDDLRIILRATGEKGVPLYRVLIEARDGLIPDVSDAGRQMADQLRKLSYALSLPHKHNGKRTAWQVLAIYLLEKSRWLREKLSDLTPENRRYLATMCQVIDLAREFSYKGTFSRSKDTRAFLDYVASARESAKLPCLDSTAVISDAVNVLTMHKSKGLQWHTVFVPHWRQKTKLRHSQVPLPKHLWHPDPSRADADEIYSEACLYYVASTRAEERLFLSTFTQDKPGTQTTLLPYLEQVINTLRPLSGLEYREPRIMPWKQSWPFQPLTPFEENIIPYAMLRQYEYCPRRAKYDYFYGLRTESGGFRFFKRQLHKALLWIAERSEQNMKPTTAEIEDKIEELWVEDSRSKRRMAKLYQPQALRCALAFAGRIPLGVSIRLNAVRTLQVPNTVPSVAVEFKIDELEDTVPRIARLHRLDAQYDKHFEDTIWSLYSHLAGEEDVTFTLSYLAHDEEIELDLLNYPEWTEEKLKELFARVRHIQAGQFKPKPKVFGMCHRCPYNLTCPA